MARGKQQTADNGQIVGQQDLNGGEVAAPAPAPGSWWLDGTLTLEELPVDGKRPYTSEITFQGVKAKVAGAFRKGDVVSIVVDAQIAASYPVDKFDKDTGQVTESVQRHVAHVLDLRAADGS